MGDHQMTRFAATLSWKSWRREDRHISTLFPVVNVRMYVPLYLIMHGSGVSMLEIWVVMLDVGRVGRSLWNRNGGGLCEFGGSMMRLSH